MIVFAAIVPHPPYSIEGIGTADEKEKIKKTLDSFGFLRKGLEKSRPDTIIIISPHGKMEKYNFVFNSRSDLQGSFSNYGLNKIFKFKNDREVLDQMSHISEMNQIFIHKHEYPLDHGVLVPIFHLLKNISPKIVHISFSLLSYEKHYKFGELVSSVLRNSKKRIAIIASGDLSHSLTPNAPAGYNPRARFFDERIIEYLGSNNISALIGMKKETIKEFRECGIRSYLLMLGMIHQEKYKFNFLSYEGPYGIGYLVARFL